MNAEKRHQRLYRAAYVLLGPILKKAFSYSCETVKPKSGNYMVLSNHNLNWDPLLVGLAFPRMMYYVASEHIFRMGFVSKLITFAMDPIVRLKATSEARTVQQMLRRLKDGYNVCVFPEGCCSFNGETCEIAGAIGKLARLSGAGLITFRLEGEYLKKPRWAKYYRKGKTRGYMVHEYTPEELKSMSAAQINDAIRSDLYYNVDEEQQLSPQPRPGKKLAEHAEWALYACPECGGLLSLKSKGNLLSCQCGLTVEADEWGRFVKDGQPYKLSTPLKWDNWQKEHIAALAREAGDKVILTCPQQTLKSYDRGSREKTCGTGKLLLYRDRMEFLLESESLSFAFDEIFDMTVHGRDVLMFSTKEGENYEVTSDILRSALCFVQVYKEFKLTER